MAKLNQAQFITIDDFIQARSSELNHFVNVLSNRTSSKLQIQLLPKHMRRRAMAHNYYRIPMKVRPRALKELAASEKPPE